MNKSPPPFAPAGLPRSGVALLLLATMALFVVLGHAAVFGAVREADEGAAAHVFQLLMALQLPLLALYLGRHARRLPLQALPLLVVLAVLWACSIVAVRAFT